MKEAYMKSKRNAGKYAHSNESLGIVRMGVVHLGDEVTVVADRWIDIYLLVFGI